MIRTESSLRSQIEATLQRARILVDSKIGVVESLELAHNPPGVPAFYRYRAKRNPLRTPEGELLHDQRDMSGFDIGWGFKRDPAHAQIAALGEAVERYCCTHTAGHTIINAPFRRITGSALDPTLVARPTAAQLHGRNIGLRPVDQDTPLLWVPATEVPTGTPTWVPADLVFLPSPQGWSIREQISTGLACGSSFWHATLSGFCEVVERDAYAIHWLMRLPGYRVAVETIPDSETRRIVQEFTAIGIQTTICNITTDLGIPTYLVVGQSEWAWPKFWVAACSSLSAVSAVRGALAESFGQLCFLLTSERRVDTTEDIRSMHDHGFYYASGRDSHLMRFFFDSSVRAFNSVDLSVGSYQESAQYIAARLSEHGLKSYVVDLTTQDVRAAGLSVVRVIVPGLQFLHHAVPCLECPRMYAVAAKNGIDPHRPIALDPHPFP